MLAFQTVDEAVASGFAQIATTNFDTYRGFSLASAPSSKARECDGAGPGACLVAQAIYEPLIQDVLQLEIDGCSKHEMFQIAELSSQVFGESVVVQIGQDNDLLPMFSPTNLLKAIQDFRRAVESFYAASPEAAAWEDSRREAADSQEHGKAAKNREQSIRYALNICKRFGFDNLEHRYQKLLKDNGLA